MITDTLKKAVSSIQTLEDEAEQLQKDNETLTDDIKKLEDEQKEGYKKFNTDTHILMERSTVNELINNLDDINSEADNTADSASQAQQDMENIESYNAEEAYDGARNIMRNTKTITDKLQDLLNPEEEGE